MGFLRTNFPTGPARDAPEPSEPIQVSRTLVKSEPELAELIDSEPRLGAAGVKVSMAEKGFGTRVAITAAPDTAIEEAELEAILDDLAEPQKRPFSGS